MDAKAQGPSVISRFLRFRRNPSWTHATGSHQASLAAIGLPRTAQDAVERLVQEGNAHFSKGKFRLARLAYSIAANICPCQDAALRAADFPFPDDVKGSQCMCKNWAEAPDESKQLTLYSLAEQDCCCGGYLDLPRCTKNGHLFALNGRAATFMELGDLDAAQKDCWLMLHMAPRRPEGYARLQQIYRRRGLRLQGFHAAKQALWVIERFGTEKSRQTPLYRSLARTMQTCPFTDPLSRLPAELTLNILQHLKTSELRPCLRVSKRWKEIICNTLDLWENIQIHGPVSPMRRAVYRELPRLMQYSRTGQRYHVKELSLLGSLAPTFTFKDCYWILANCPRLTHLTVKKRRPVKPEERLPNHAASPYRPQDVRIEAPLEQLHLENAGASNLDWLVDVLRASRHTLKGLSVFGHCAELTKDHAKADFVFDNLTTLELVSHEGYVQRSLDLDALKASTPNLRALALDGWDTYFGRRWHISTDGTEVSAGTAWGRLEKLVLGSLTCRQSFPLFGDLSDLPNLKVLDVSGLAMSQLKLCWTRQADETRLLQVPKLELFRLSESVSEDVLRFLEPCLRNGSLKTLDVSVPFEGALPDAPDDYPTTNLRKDATHQLDQLDRWLVSKRSITTLGLSGFRWNNSASYTTSYTGLPLALWVREFPNVQTVYAYPQKFDGSMDTIRALLDVAQVKTIYQDCLHGIGRDEILRLAKERGVEIVDSNDRAPGPWPPYREGAYAR